MIIYTNTCTSVRVYVCLSQHLCQMTTLYYNKKIVENLRTLKKTTKMKVYTLTTWVAGCH